MTSAATYHTASPDAYVFGAPTLSINSVYRLGIQLGQAGSFGVCRLATRLTDGTPEWHRALACWVVVQSVGLFLPFGRE
jgi:hypothetical protein